MKDKRNSKVYIEHNQKAEQKIETRQLAFPDGVTRSLALETRIWRWHDRFLEDSPHLQWKFLAKMLRVAVEEAPKRGVSVEEELTQGFTYTWNKINSLTFEKEGRFI